MATAAFEAAWNQVTAQRARLVRIDFTVPNARTVYLSTRPDTRADGRVWEPLIIRPEAMVAPGEWLSTGPELVTFAFSMLQHARFGWQTAPADTIASSLTTYRWNGAKVTAWLWEQSLTNFTTDAFQDFVGEIDGEPMLFEEPVDDNNVVYGIRVSCTQSWIGNPSIQPKLVDRATYPLAGDAVIGAALPILYGKLDMEPMRGESWPLDITTQTRRDWEIAGGLITGGPAILVDPGKGSGATNPKAKIVVAGHACKQVMVTSANYVGAIKGGTEDPNVLAITAAGDVINNANEAGAFLDDQGWRAYQRIPVQEINPTIGPCDGASLLMDLPTEYRPIIFDWDSARLTCEFRLGSTKPPGKATNLNLLVFYQTLDGTDQGQELYVNHPLAGIAGLLIANQTINGFTASAARTRMNLNLGVVGGVIFSQSMGRAWDFTDIIFGFRFRAGTWTGKQFKVFAVAMFGTYLPAQRTIRVEKKMVPRTDLYARSQVKSGRRNIKAYIPLGQVPVYTAITEAEGNFYSTAQGYADDGSGTFTGVASALIERAPDIARHLLQTYGAVSSGSIETGTSTHGSFVDARALLQTFAGDDLRYGRAITETVGLSDVLTDLAAQSVSRFFINRLTGKYVWVPWLATAPASVRTFYPRDLTGPLQVDSTGRDSVITDIRFSYLRDAARGREMATVAAGPAHSQAGHHFMNFRDEYLTVVASVNDKFDWYDGTAFRSVTLDPGDYTPSTIVSNLRSKITGGGFNGVPSYGFTIIAGINDTMGINDGAGKTVTVTPGTYDFTTGPAAVAAAFNAVSSNWSCTFDRTTRKFTIARSSGTAQLNVLSTASGLAVLLGYDCKTNKTGAASYLADYEREEDRFSFGLTAVNANAVMRWKVGPNGLDGTRTNCAELLGFLSLYDRTGQSCYLGDSPKGNREQVLAAAAALYKAKREMTLPGNWLRNTYTARTIRNRLIDLAATERRVITFPSFRGAVLERGQIFDMSADFDKVRPFPKYGSNGSWAGRKFWVLEVHQNNGPDRFDTEIVGVEA